MAQRISVSEAADIASQVLGKRAVKTEMEKPTKVLSQNGEEQKEPFYCIFTGTDGHGFVVISLDRRAPQIIGYGDGEADSNNIPPQLKEILAKQDSVLHATPNLPEHNSWRNKRLMRVGEEGGKILKTANWGQGYPYNMYAQEVDGTKCPAGCVATAMAIVMKYHNFPNGGRGKHLYWSNGEKLEFDFDSAKFDYSLLLDEYTEGNYTEEQAQAVGYLLKAAAASVNMQYDLYGSGAMVEVAGHYLHENFHFSPDCQYIRASNFSESEWWSKIKLQIDNNLPIIYSGRGETGGHAFVCDGYDANQNLHINWGWDGILNGYYNIDSMGGFSETQGMIFNIAPSADDTIYSRCWNDYGYLWATAGQSVGINISTESIVSGENFDAIAGQVTFPADFSGQLTLALVNSSNEILQLARTQDNYIYSHCYEANHDLDHIGYTWAGHGNMILEGMHFDVPVKDDYRLAIVSKEDNEEVWRMVLGTEEAPSSIPVIGNTPYISRIHWSYHGDTHILKKSFYDRDESVLIGNDYPEGFDVSGGVAYMLIDGKYRTNGSDFSIFGMNFVAMKPDYAIDIYCNTYDKLLERKYTLNDGDNIADIIPENEKNLIHKLTVLGNLSEENYSFILTQLPSLQYLDISETDMTVLPDENMYYTTGDMIGRTTHGLVSIKLPNVLEEFAPYALGFRSLEYLQIPASVTKYGYNSVSGNAGDKMDLVHVLNPEPVSFQDNAGILNDAYDYRSTITLLVPKGSKEKYLSHPNWQGFRDIIETEQPSNERFVDINGARYLLVHGFASLSGFYTSASYGVILDGIEVDGEWYPINYLNSHAHFPLLVYYERTKPLDVKGWFGGIINEIVTPLLDLSNTFIDSGNIYVPGGFDNKGNTIFNPLEMWSYDIDHKRGILQIRDVINDVEISDVIINGEKKQYKDGIFLYDNSLPLDVKVNFSHRNQHQMTTHYTPEFNSLYASANDNVQFEEVSITVSDRNIIIKNAADKDCQILRPDGIIIHQDKTKAQTKEYKCSAPGVYIVRAGEISKKIVVR